MFFGNLAPPCALSHTGPTKRLAGAVMKHRMGPRRIGAALAALALASCTPAGLLNGVSRISGDGATRLAVRGAAYGPLARHRLDIWVPA
jgi:hypothetical protein